MTALITNQSTAVFQNPEMSQLKRKSFGESPSPDDGHHDEPSKRVKVEDIVDQSAVPAQPMERNDSNADDSGQAKDRDSLHRDVVLKAEDPSQDTRRLAETDASPLSPRPERKPSNTRRRESSSHTRSPDQDRRPDESHRRSRSPVRLPDQGRRSHGDHRRRDASPPRRERRESETARRDEGINRITKPAFVNKEEEKKRGKRLFGGLLSTLSQTTTNSQQKRRQEIEKRQQEKAAKQKSEDDLRRNERLAKLDRIRKIEQVRFDEQVMRTRHSNMLAMAQGLQTKSEPKLYYRPWELTKEQEAIIKDQLRDAAVQIEDELQHFKRDKAHRLTELGALPPPTADAETVVAKPVEENRSSNAAQDESAATATNDRKPSPTPAAATEDKDQGEMVEAEEDTVIY